MMAYTRNITGVVFIYNAKWIEQMEKNVLTHREESLGLGKKLTLRKL